MNVPLSEVGIRYEDGIFALSSCDMRYVTKSSAEDRGTRESRSCVTSI